MPIKKAAKKFMKTSRRQRERNLAVKKTMREAIGNTKRLIEKKAKKEEIEKALQQAIKAIDKAAQKKVIKKNNAARRKSRLIKAGQKLAKKKQ